MLAGEPAVAVSLLRADDKALETMGERDMRSTLTGLLAHALEAIGEDEEGLRFAELARELVGRGGHGRAGRLADGRGEDPVPDRRRRDGASPRRRGARDGGGSDLLDLQGNAAADAALVYARLGLESESRAQLGSARELFMQKENIAAIALVEGRLVLGRPGFLTGLRRRTCRRAARGAALQIWKGSRLVEDAGPVVVGGHERHLEPQRRGVVLAGRLGHPAVRRQLGAALEGSS